MSAFELIPQKHVFCGTLPGNSARKNRLHNQAPAKQRVQVQFRVQHLPEPELDRFEPELMVQFTVQAKEALN